VSDSPLLKAPHSLKTAYRQTKEVSLVFNYCDTRTGSFLPMTFVSLEEACHYSRAHGRTSKTLQLKIYKPCSGWYKALSDSEPLAYKDSEINAREFPENLYHSYSGIADKKSARHRCVSLSSLCGLGASYVSNEIISKLPARRIPLMKWLKSGLQTNYSDVRYLVTLKRPYLHVRPRCLNTKMTEIPIK